MALNHYTEVTDIEKYEQIYNKELMSGIGVREKTRFEYAWCLVQSIYLEDKQKGIQLLEGLLSEKEQRDYLYFLALGYYRTADYIPAQKTIDRLLKIEPDNTQALLLKKEIKKAITTDGLVGIGIVGGILAVGAIAITALLKK